MAFLLTELLLSSKWNKKISLGTTDKLVKFEKHFNLKYLIVLESNLQLGKRFENHLCEIHGQVHCIFDW